MNRVGVKILLAHGHFLALSMTEAEFLTLVSGWKEALRAGGGFLSGSDYFQAQRWDWCVNASKVIGIHSFIVPPNALNLGNTASGLPLMN